MGYLILEIRLDACGTTYVILSDCRFSKAWRGLEIEKQHWLKYIPIPVMCKDHGEQDARESVHYSGKTWKASAIHGDCQN